MNEYIFENRIVLGNDIQIAMLNTEKNVHFINSKNIPPDQMGEINKYKNKYDRDKRILARTFLYDFINYTYGITNFELEFNEYKKPFLKNSTHINFSFSYANENILVGTSNDKRIGVDIEYIDPNINIREIACEILCPAELDKFNLYMDGSPDQQVYLFNSFSAKESIIKAFGTGLYFNVKELNLLESKDFVYNSRKYKHQEFDVWKDEYVSSVCYEEL
jgi:4'-phosphopantetheinyl transferase